MLLPMDFMKHEVWQGNVSTKKPLQFDGAGMLILTCAILRKGGAATLFCKRDGDKASFAICRLTEGQSVCQVQLHLEGAPATLTCVGADANILVSGTVRPFAVEESIVKRPRLAEAAAATHSSPVHKPASPASKAPQQPAVSSSPARKPASPVVKPELLQSARSSSPALKPASPALTAQKPATPSSPARKAVSPALKPQQQKPASPALKPQSPKSPSLQPAAVEDPSKKSKGKRLVQVAPLSARKYPSGLEYEIIVAGTGGRIANLGQSVEIRHTGRIVGQEKLIDSGTSRFRLGMGDVIRGWDEGIKGMLIGETRRLHVPSRLAYGIEGHQPKIPPNSNLVYEVELLKC